MKEMQDAANGARLNGPLKIYGMECDEDYTWSSCWSKKYEFMCYAMASLVGVVFQ